jgi:hypothetical protein
LDNTPVPLNWIQDCLRQTRSSVRQPTLPKISQSYLVAPRIDAAQPFNCKKWKEVTFLWRDDNKIPGDDAGCPEVTIKDRDTTILKVLQIETIKTTTFYPESCI